MNEKFIYYAQVLNFIEKTVNKESHLGLLNSLSKEQKKAIKFLLFQDQILQKLVLAKKINISQAQSALQQSTTAIHNNTIKSFFSATGVTFNDLQVTIQQSQNLYNEEQKKIANLILQIESNNKVKEKPQHFGHYQVIQKLGSGGMATVYKAYDQKLQRFVAIKKMHGSDHKIQERFLQEAQITAKLKHPNIIAVHEICEKENYIVMDFIDGQPLSQSLKNKRLNIRQGLENIRDIAHAVHYAHNQKIIHRDLKPDNIMVEVKTGRCVVMDFGIAKNFDAKNNLTKTGEIIGTPRYMAPEQFQGKKANIGRQVDIYALGAILYEVLTSKQLILGNNTMNLMYEIIHTAPIPPRSRNPRLSMDLETICLKAIEKSPQKRYVTAAKFAADIDSFLKGEIISAKRKSRLYVHWQSLKKRKSFAATILSLLLLIGYLVYQSNFAAAYIKIVLKTPQQEIIKDQYNIIINKKTVVPNSNGYIKLNSGVTEFTINSKLYEEKKIRKKIFPGETDIIRETLTPIKGTVSFNSVLENINVSLSKNAQPPIQINAPTTNYELDIGKYSVTFSKQNYFSYTIETEVSKKKPFKHNIHLIPMKMWSSTIFAQPQAIAIASADLDKDGFAELIYGTKNGDLYCFSLKLQKQLWKITSEFSEENAIGSIQILDINRDGIDDIVWAHYTEFSIIDGRTQEHLFHQLNWWGQEFIFTNVNSDVYPDLIMFPRYQGVRCLDVINQKILWSQQNFIARDFCNPTFISKNEIALTQGNYYKQKNSGISIINIQNGHIRNAKKYSGYTMAMDYDPKTKLLALFHPKQGLHSKSLVSDKQSCLQSKAYRYVDTPKFFDIDNDSRKEIISFTDKLYAFDTKNNKIKYTLWDPQQGRFTRNNLRKYIIDINNDKIPEVIAVFDHVITISNYKQKPIVLKLPEKIISCVFLDTNNDNILEIIGLSSKTLYCYSCYPMEKTYVVDENTRLDKFRISPHNNHVIVSTVHGNIKTFNSKNWQKLSEFNAKGNIGVVSFATGNILKKDLEDEVVIHHNKNITLVKNSKEIWNTNVGGIPLAKDNAMVLHDQNGDGNLNIYSNLLFGSIVCLEATTGKILWQINCGRLYIPPCFIDKDCIFPSAQGMHCVNANGKIKWKTPLPSAVESPTMQKFENTIIVGQKLGFITAINIKTGRATWTRKLPCSMINSAHLFDIDNDKNLDYVCTTIRGKLIALNPKNGTVKWIKNNPHYRTTLLDKSNNQLLVTGNTFTVAKINSFGNSEQQLLYQGIIPNNAAKIIDINNDNKKDFLFINDQGKLVCIYNWSKYQKRKRNLVIGNNSYTTQLLYDIQLNKLQIKPNTQIAKNAKSLSVSLLKVSQFIQQKNWLKANNLLQSLQFQYPKCIEVKFLRLVEHMHNNKKIEALKIIKQCTDRSLLHFEKLWEKYRHIFSNHVKFKQYTHSALSKNITPYEQLEKIYWGFIYNNQHRKSQDILPVLAKYDLNKEKQYLTQYKNLLWSKIDKNISSYTQYTHIEYIDAAITALITDNDLHFSKALYNFIYGYSTSLKQLEKATDKATFPKKQALGYAILVLLSPNKKIHLQKFSRLNLQKSQFSYKIYKCVQSFAQKKHKSKIVNKTFQQHAAMINQNPVYSYIFNKLRQRR
ncbi:protein kinase [Candidatus Uabimicrobium sp. HlEnr_7]|uniref:serine/threonine-protein kinase n=1 Tax=Candidatus Uabimicrobium helgolandensis TaxID=3095367 RepID=UPI0035562D42